MEEARGVEKSQIYMGNPAQVIFAEAGPMALPLFIFYESPFVEFILKTQLHVRRDFFVYEKRYQAQKDDRFHDCTLFLKIPLACVT